MQSTKSYSTGRNSGAIMALLAPNEKVGKVRSVRRVERTFYGIVETE